MLDKWKRAQALLEQAPEPAAARAAAEGQMATPQQVAQNVRAQAQRTPMLSPETMRNVERARQRGALSPNQAAINALYQSGQTNADMFSGRGFPGYVKRRGIYAALIMGIGRNPTSVLAAGGMVGFDKLWSLAMRSPESAAAYWRFIQKFAQPGWHRTVGKGFMSLMGALLDNALKGDVDQQPQDLTPAQEAHYKLVANLKHNTKSGVSAEDSGLGTERSADELKKALVDAHTIGGP